jgi:RNA polymerase sigma-70 factor (family 1)
MKKGNYSDLIIGFQNGDEKAFSQLYDLYYGPIYYFILRILDNNSEAQEITADTFLKLWKLRANFESVENVKAFLYITAKNASLNVIKQRKEHSRRHQEFNYLLSQDAEGPSMQDEIKGEVLKEVLKEIENLPQQCRRILQFSFIRGLKNMEIADEMGLTLQTVKNQKTRGLKMLKLSLATRVWQVLLVCLSFFTL